MIKNSILKYLQYQLRIIDTNILIINHFLYKKSIHELRLAIKRSRAIQAFIFAKRNNTNKNPKKYKLFLRKLYKPIGLIRDCQVQLTLVRFFEKELNREFIAYKKNLSRKRSSAKVLIKNKLSKNYHSRIRKFKKEANDWIKQNNEEKLTELKTFLISRLFQKLKNANKNTSYLSLHGLRKNIKEAYYIIEAFSFNTEMPQEDILLLNKLKNVGHILGEWLDREVLLQNLDKFEISAKEQKKYKPLENQITSVNKDDLEIIKIKIKELVDDFQSTL